MTESPDFGSPTTARLITTDRYTLEIAVRRGSTLLEASREANLALPGFCEEGTCGVCRATLLHGDVDPGIIAPYALPAGLRAAGGILLCQARPGDSDVEVALPYGRQRIGRGAQDGAARRTGHISALESVASGTWRLALQLQPHPELGLPLRFEPGQFMKVAVPGSPFWRSYSLTNLSNDEGIAEFYIRNRPTGAFSRYLARAAVGDQLTIEGPSGAFGLVENGPRPRWFVSGGTGLTPLLSMLRSMSAVRAPQPVRFIVGVETAAEILAPLLIDPATLPGGYALDIAVRRGEAESDWPAELGTSVDVMTRRLAEAPEPPDVYLCGPGPFMAAGRSAAIAAGVPARQVYTESILSSTSPPR